MKHDYGGPQSNKTTNVSFFVFRKGKVVRLLTSLASSLGISLAVVKSPQTSSGTHGAHIKQKREQQQWVRRA